MVAGRQGHEMSPFLREGEGGLVTGLEKGSRMEHSMGGHHFIEEHSLNCVLWNTRSLRCSKRDLCVHEFGRWYIPHHGEFIMHIESSEESD